MIGEPLAKGYSRLGIQMLLEARLGQANLAAGGAERGQSEVGFAESTADIENVAGFGAGPNQGASPSDFADDRNIYKDAILARRVAAGDWAFQFSRSLAQAD